MTTKYLFIADGELKIFLSELIARQYCQDGEHHFFSYTPRVQSTWDLYPWKTKTLMPWVHRQGVVKKYWNLRSRLHQILKSVGDACPLEDGRSPDQIILHTYQICSERTNYLYHYLCNRFPTAEIKFRLVPDGTLNLTRRPMGINKLSQYINYAKWAGDPLLKPYLYNGDRLGADAGIVDRIYLPHGFPNEYEESKLYWIDMPRTTHQQADKNDKTALVVGTALTQTGVCTKKDMAQVARRFGEVLQEQGITKAYYKPHHKEDPNYLELWSEGCEVLETQKGIERLVLGEPFDLLLGHCSTSLITSKLMCKDLNVVCCGLEVIEKRSRSRSSVHKYRQVCESLGIPLISAESTSQQHRRAA